MKYAIFATAACIVLPLSLTAAEIASVGIVTYVVVNGVRKHYTK
jgi:hypothetical protein